MQQQSIHQPQLPSQVGESLIKYRFPLSWLSWITYNGSTNAVPAYALTNAAAINPSAAATVPSRRIADQVSLPPELAELDNVQWINKCGTGLCLDQCSSNQSISRSYRPQSANR